MLFRSKKCTNIIAVRGDQVAAPAEEQAPAYDYGSDQVWHVVVDGDQQGPFAPSQLGGMLTDGTIDWEAYVWKESFDGWKPARDVPELVAAITGEPAAEEDSTVVADSASAAFGGGAAAADPFGGAAADPFGGGAAADPFGGAAAAPAAAPAPADPFGGSDPFGGGGGEAARASADAGADLFAGGGDAAFGASDDVVASAPSPRVSADQAMTGQRNENSVLFSLSNLQALATGSSGGGGGGGGGSPSASPSAAPAGHATGEGSGLIDIRALASATAATSSPSGGSSSSGGVDDLLSIGGGGGGLGPSLGAPVLAPAAAEPEKGGKGLIIGAVAGGLVVVGLLVALIVVLMDKPAEQVAAAPTALAGEATPANPTAEPAVAAPAAAGVAMDAPTAEAADEGSEGDEGDEGDEGEASAGSTGLSAAARRRRRAARMGSTNSATPAEMATPSPMASRMSSANADIDDLLAGALGGGGSMMSAPMMAAAMSNLPAQPGRDDVGGALRRVSSRVGGCGNGTAGTAQARIVFASSGRVRSVNVTGVPPAVQSCVARAVRGARVPPFSRATFNVNYPFRVR